jgi:hypothetical protein
MAVPEMQKAIARLRLMLATIRSKEAELEGLRRDFQGQLDRAPASVIQVNSPLELSLAAMGEIQERLDDVALKLRHLAAIKTRVQSELDALELTTRIETAKGELAVLKSRDGNSGLGDAERKEMRDLERFIQDASAQAGQAITQKKEHLRH